MQDAQAKTTRPSEVGVLPKVYLPLGGSGFLGSNLGEALMDDGHHVIVLDRLAPHWDSERYRGRGEFVCVSDSEVDVIAQVVARRRVDVFIHLASSLLPGSSIDALCSDVSANLLPAFRLFDVLLAHGMRRFVYLSSGGTVYGLGNGSHTETDPLCPLNYYGWMSSPSRSSFA